MSLQLSNFAVVDPSRDRADLQRLLSPNTYVYPEPLNDGHSSNQGDKYNRSR